MRPIASILGLLLVVATVGILGKRHLAAVANPPGPGGSALAPLGPLAPGTSPAQQSLHLQQQVQQAVDAALRQPRPTGDDTP